MEVLVINIGLFRVYDGYIYLLAEIMSSKAEQRIRPFLVIPLNSCAISISSDSNYDYHIEPQ